MTQNIVNRLKFILIGVVLLVVLFTVIAFAVPFTNKFNSLYWVSFGAFYLTAISAIFFLAVCSNVEEYQTKKIANKVSCVSLGFVAVVFALAMIFMGVSIDAKWIPIIIFAVIYVCKLMLLFYIMLTNKDIIKEEKE